MNRFIQILLVALVAATASAFTVPVHNNKLSMKPVAYSRQPESSILTSSTMDTALRLKMDVKELEKNAASNSSGNAKMAAYGGSVVIALALPLAFLAWSAIH